MRGGKRSGAGRKCIKIDFELLERLSALQCTDEEIAATLGVSTRTIESRRKQPAFAQALERGKAKGRISVRRAQMRQLEAGNAAIAIWLGKQLLGQRDVTPLDFQGPSGQEERMSLGVLDEIIKQAQKKPRNRSDR
jgi:hypothetical protein